MKNYYFKLSILIFLMFTCVISLQAQQDVQFSQYMFNGLVLNPAYAGADEKTSLTFFHRAQWGKAEGAPVTQTFTAHTLLKKQKLGLGLSVMNDKIGVHQNLKALISTAYHLQVGAENFLSFGAEAGIRHQESDYLSLGGNTYNDPRIASTLISQNLIQLGFGFYYRSPRLHVGLSMPGIVPGKIQVNDSISFDLKSTHYYLFTRYSVPLTNQVDIEPGFLLKYRNGVPLSWDANISLVFKKVLAFGISYRKNESLDFLVRMRVTPRLQFGYGYDHVIGNVSVIGTASHEFMVNYLFRFSHTNITSPR